MNRYDKCFIYFLIALAIFYVGIIITFAVKDELDKPSNADELRIDILSRTRGEEINIIETNEIDKTTYIFFQVDNFNGVVRYDKNFFHNYEFYSMNKGLGQYFINGLTFGTGDESITEFEVLGIDFNDEIAYFTVKIDTFDLITEKVDGKTFLFRKKLHMKNFSRFKCKVRFFNEEDEDITNKISEYGRPK